jgi:hypothetical protein
MGLLNPALHLHQHCTYWAATRQGTGFSYASPVLLPCRWEDTAEVFLGPNAENRVSNSIVYLTVDVAAGDFLMLGDYTSHASPADVKGAGRVQRFLKTPTVAADEFERKAML